MVWKDSSRGTAENRTHVLKQAVVGFRSDCGPGFLRRVREELFQEVRWAYTVSRLVLLDRLKELLGRERVSDWFQIDQDRVDAFADCTGDHQWIHVNPELAKDGPYGTTIAHGNLTLSLTLWLTTGREVMPVGSKMCLNYGYNKVRFLSPVKVGSRIRSHAVVKQVEDKGEGRILVTTEYTVEVEGEKKSALVAENLSMFLTS